MRHTKKPFGARVVSLILAAALMAGMAPALASQGDFQKWKADYDEYWYDPYEEYYEAWGIPSVMQVYEERGEKAADNYIGLFRSNLQFDDAKEQMQEFVSHLDQAYPIIVETPDPTAGWTAENDPYKEIYRSLDLPNFGEVEQQMGRKYAVHWRQVSEGAETGVVKVQGYEYPVEKGLPFSYELMKSWYEADQQQQKEEQEKKPTGAISGALTDDTGLHDDGWYYDKNGNRMGIVAEIRDGYYCDEYGNRLGPVQEDNPNNQGIPVRYFSDVAPDAWYAKAVNTMVDSGILHGYGDGSFRPEDPITVGEWCTIIWNIVGQNIAPTAGTVYYQDAVSSHWASHAVWRCQENGYSHVPWTMDPELEGVDPGDESVVLREAGTYHEDRLTLRGEAATAIMAILEKDPDSKNWIGKLNGRQRKNGEKTDWTLDQIPDADVIQKNVERKDKWQAWDVDSIVNAYNLGILHGVDGKGTCDPYGTMTRAEACQMLYNALIMGPHPLPGGNGGYITGG